MPADLKARNPARGYRILLLSINYTPEMIGVGRYAGELGAYLSSRGVELEVVTTPPHYPGWKVQAPFRNSYSVEVVAGTRITRCPLYLPKRVRGFSRLLVALSFALSSAGVVIWRAVTRRPEVILATEPALFSAPAAVLAARLCGARAILHVQDLEIEAAFAMGHLNGRWIQSLARQFDRMVLRAFDRVVTISDRMRLSLEGSGVPPDRLSVIRNWVDLEAIRPLGYESPFRREWGLSSSAYVVLYAGSIGVKQALHLLVEAAAMLSDRPDVQVVIAGDGPEKARLVASAPPNVRFIPLQPEERLRDLLCAADLHVLPQDGGAADLVLPSKLGGMLASGGNILVQAASGTELNDFLRDAACIVPPGESRALADAIRRLAATRPARNERGLALAGQLSSKSLLPAFYRLLLGASAANSL